MSGSIDGLRLRRAMGQKNWLAPTLFGSDGWLMYSKGYKSSIIATCAAWDDGVEWVHASMAHVARMPSYEEMCQLHDAVFGDGYSYEVHAPKAQHVNIHEHALHLWGRLDGKPALPEFGKYGTI